MKPIAKIKVLLDAARAAVVDLEGASQGADRAARRARDRLTILELELEDEMDISEGGSAAYLERPRSPGSNRG